jgi:hypothetical protein
MAVFRKPLKLLVLERRMYDFAFVLGLADEECCPIVLKFFHSHIYIKNKDISSTECNIWDYYPQILAPMSA